MREDECLKDDDSAPELASDNGKAFPSKQLFFLGISCLVQ
jgi:hypothetical protein